jgi:hypothetical protein
MTPDKIAEEYFRWRLELMKVEAPAPPSAAQLIERARPWWERWPDRFHSLAGHLETKRTGHPHNGDQPNPGPDGIAVQALIVRGKEETKGFARVLDFKIHDAKLHFRFQLDPPFTPGASSLEVTFISDTAARALFFAQAFGSGEIGYIVYTELPPELARDWASLKETDPLPFRMILRSGPWA